MTIGPSRYATSRHVHGLEVQREAEIVGIGRHEDMLHVRIGTRRSGRNLGREFEPA